MLKLERIRTWHFLAVAILFSEVFTFVLSSLQSLFRRGTISREVTEIGAIDALCVSLVVTAMIIPLVRYATKITVERNMLQNDMAARKQAEAALRNANAYNRSLIEASLDSLVIIGLDGKITDVNAATEAATGRSRKELIGTDYFAYVTEPEKARAGYKQVFREGTVRDYALEIRRSDGHVTPVLYNAAIYRDDSGKVVGVFAAARDITERKKAEAALNASEAFIGQILESVDEGFIVLDRHYRIILANRAFCNYCHVNPGQPLGHTCYETIYYVQKPCFETGQECPVRRVFETGEVSTASKYRMEKDGSKRYMEMKAFPIKDTVGGVVSVIETISDVTERKRLEEQFLQAQKLESVGLLAGGVAHDFNNILAAMSGYGNLLQIKMAENDPLKVYVEHILEAVDRATSVTHSLLAFSRKQVMNLQSTHINDTIGKFIKLFARVIGEDIELTTRLANENLIVMADPAQIEQMLMNLVVNARDAMPDGGRLTIGTELTQLDAAFNHAHGYGNPGHYVLISVSDTGIGMDNETVKRIFEPFFTTKKVGKGTGLGLAMVYGAVKQHNGYINVNSEHGHGTTFRIYLPKIDIDKGNSEIAPTQDISLRGGTETILLAEDDPKLRELFEIILKEYGYEIIPAEDGEKAVARFKQNKDKIRLVILDMIMPKKSGMAACEEIRQTRPDVKVLFSSGYTDDRIDSEKIRESGYDFIMKPVSPKDLLKKVREMLDK